MIFLTMYYSGKSRVYSRGYGAEDGEGLAGCRECHRRARGVVRGDGDNVNFLILDL